MKRTHSHYMGRGQHTSYYKEETGGWQPMLELYLPTSAAEVIIVHNIERGVVSTSGRSSRIDTVTNPRPMMLQQPQLKT